MQLHTGTLLNRHLDRLVSSHKRGPKLSMLKQRCAFNLRGLNYNYSSSLKFCPSICIPIQHDLTAYRNAVYHWYFVQHISIAQTHVCPIILSWYAVPNTVGPLFNEPACLLPSTTADMLHLSLRLAVQTHNCHCSNSKRRLSLVLGQQVLWPLCTLPREAIRSASTAMIA